MPDCQNCGAFVTKQYVRVFEPSEMDDASACPHCTNRNRIGTAMYESGSL